MVYRRPRAQLLSFMLVGSLAACSGAVADRDSESDADEGGNSGDGSDEDGSDPVAPGQAPEAERCQELRKAQKPPVVAQLRRLSWQEIANALSDLFPQTKPTEFDDLVEPSHMPTRSAVALEINESFVRAYRPALAKFCARAATAIVQGPCKTGGAACLESQTLKLARQAWRTNLGEDEGGFVKGKLSAFTAEVGAAPGFSAAIELVLASPRFLFLADPGTLQGDASEDGRFTASGDRLAGLWAAAVWGSVPDETLLDAAAAGDLDDKEGRRAQLDRMLNDARARRGLSAFFRTWLGYNQVMKLVKDETIFPNFDDDVRKEMLTDTESTLLELMFDEAEPATALLRSPLGTPGAKTVALLGWSKNAVQAKRQSLEAVGRYGVATHPAVLSVTSKANATSIINRGRFVVERLACGHIPEPPKNVDIDIEKLDEETGGVLSGRQLAERHATDPACAGCHKFMDPFGMVFENFDAVGRQRSEDNGVTIDTHVQLDDALGITGSFDGAAALLDAVAATGRTERCFATNFAHFVMPVELTEGQACAVTDFAYEDGRARSMLDVTRAFLLSDTFITRSSTAN